MCLVPCFCLSKVNCILLKAGPRLRKTWMWQVEICICLYVEQGPRHLRGQGTEVSRESHLIRIRTLWEIWDISDCGMLCENLRVVTTWRMGHHHHYHHHNDTSLLIIMTPRQRDSITRSVTVSLARGEFSHQAVTSAHLNQSRHHHHHLFVSFYPRCYCLHPC